MRIHLLLLVIGMSTFLETVSGGTFCFPDQNLTVSGDCVDCAYCPSAEGVGLYLSIALKSYYFLRDIFAIMPFSFMFYIYIFIESELEKKKFCFILYVYEIVVLRL